MNTLSASASKSPEATPPDFAAVKTRQILDDPSVDVLSPSHALFLDGLALYESRPDKGYSLTDCISMHVMRRDGLTDVLTNDRHFTQEGFHILFP